MKRKEKNRRGRSLRKERKGGRKEMAGGGSVKREKGKKKTRKKSEKDLLHYRFSRDLSQGILMTFT